MAGLRSGSLERRARVSEDPMTQAAKSVFAAAQRSGLGEEHLVAVHKVYKVHIA